MKVPNPGSKEAKDQGCTCAVIDNNHGEVAPWPPNGWWVTEWCPIHDDRTVAALKRLSDE